MVPFTATLSRKMHLAHGVPRQLVWLIFALLTQADACLKVVLIRHGETEWNTQGRLQGASDSPLTANGLRGATACGRRLRDRTFAAAYASPLLRARRTAELILAELPDAPPLQEDTRIRERAFGSWEGLVWATIQSERAEELARADKDPHYAISGGGESRSATLERALSFMQGIADQHGGTSDSILIVTHSATATCLIKHVLGLRQEQRRSFEVFNNALNEFEYDAAREAWRLLTLGDRAHLDVL